MNHAKLSSAFVRLGHSFKDSVNANLALAKRKAAHENLWFDEKSIEYSLNTWSECLQEIHLQQWIEKEGLDRFVDEPKNIGIVMAGNIPLVGLHDLLCVLMSGHRAYVKLSTDDTALMRFVIDELKHYDPWIDERIVVTDRLNGVQGLIATGSNNSSRYFEYYFRDIPHIIRKNRNSLAILTGDETEAEIFAIGFDIFMFYGLGCRNVTQLLLPETMSPTVFYDAIADHYEVLNHNKYANNYTYHRALFLLNQQEHLDNNFLLLKKDTQLYSPVGCLNYSFYKDIEELETYVQNNQEQIQAIVSKGSFSFPTVLPGEAQKPGLSDYADGVNPIRFCFSVK